MSKCALWQTWESSHFISQSAYDLWTMVFRIIVISDKPRVSQYNGIQYKFQITLLPKVTGTIAKYKIHRDYLYAVRKYL